MAPRNSSTHWFLLKRAGIYEPANSNGTTAFEAAGTLYSIHCHTGYSTPICAKPFDRHYYG